MIRTNLEWYDGDIPAGIAVSAEICMVQSTTLHPSDAYTNGPRH
jgi:hypothetical protein